MGSSHTLILRPGRLTVNRLTNKKAPLGAGPLCCVCPSLPPMLRGPRRSPPSMIAPRLDHVERRRDAVDLEVEPAELEPPYARGRIVRRREAVMCAPASPVSRLVSREGEPHVGA